VGQRAVRDGADIEDIRHGAYGKIGAEGISRAKEAGRDIRGSKIEILRDNVGIQDRFCEGIAQLVPFDGRIDQRKGRTADIQFREWIDQVAKLPIIGLRECGCKLEGDPLI